MCGINSADNHQSFRGAKRSPRTVRFQDTEWQRISKIAEARGITPAEFVRFATLSMTTKTNGVAPRVWLGVALQNNADGHPFRLK